MSHAESNIRIPVDLTNPGQFFACCGLLELADRLSPGAEGWFKDGAFLLQAANSLGGLVDPLRRATVTNTLSAAQNLRLRELSAMPKKERDKAEFDEEKKALDSLRRETPIVFR